MNKITIQNSGNSFDVRPSQTILEGAIAAGINLPYGCRNGACGSCKAKVISGKVMHNDYQQSAMSDAELAAGNALLCCAMALEDVTITCREVGGLSGIKPRILPARVAKKEQLAHDVIALHLQLPASERLQFLAGQYLEFILKDGQRRSFSIANAPHDSDFIQVHLRVIPNGTFTNFVANELQEKAILRLEAPLGSFFLREDTEKPVIFIATGTGIAPIKGIIEHMLHHNMQREMHLYYGARNVADLYLHDLCEKWAAFTPHLHYTPVLSKPLASDQWQGQTGYVQDALLREIPDLAGYQVYACGSPNMIDDARVRLTQHGLPEEAFFSDAFTFAQPVK
jgi:CDP-4-dehydro-6-deoxyglucose reductase, E3